MGLTTYVGSADPIKMLMAVISSIQYIVDYFTGSVENTDTSHLDTSLSNPFKVIQWGGIGALVGGVIGYYIGDIFSNPKGQASDAGPSSYAYGSSEPDGEAMTGNETFLDELDEIPAEEEEDESREPAEN